MIKPAHAGWLVEFYKMILKKNIYSRWRASELIDAVNMGQVNLPPTDPSKDLDQLLPSRQETQEFDSVIAIPEEQNELRSSSVDKYDQSSDDNSEWE